MGMKHKTIVNGKVIEAVGKTSVLDGGEYISVDNNGNELTSVTKEDYMNIVNNYIDKCLKKGVRRLDFTVGNKEEVTTYSVRPSILRDYEKATGENIRKYEDGELKISEFTIEWLIKNKYKNKYLQLLEDYKMLLTEIYKKNGGYYDNFLGRN